MKELSFKKKETFFAKDCSHTQRNFMSSINGSTISHWSTKMWTNSSIFAWIKQLWVESNFALMKIFISSSTDILYFELNSIYQLGKRRFLKFQSKADLISLIRDWMKQNFPPSSEYYNTVHSEFSTKSLAKIAFFL